MFVDFADDLAGAGDPNLFFFQIFVVISETPG
jgi:hypothetical protein